MQQKSRKEFLSCVDMTAVRSFGSVVVNSRAETPSENGSLKKTGWEEGNASSREREKRKKKKKSHAVTSTEKMPWRMLCRGVGVGEEGYLRYGKGMWRAPCGMGASGLVLLLFWLFFGRDLLLLLRLLPLNFSIVLLGLALGARSLVSPPKTPRSPSQTQTRVADA
ncbi:hypothetical protein CPAR01_02596 [Colletotrichum paranaense]|uniref:Uncharacterized protein n=1 Tax=Colletotrichum paranaense TaxID=1914294 RepID=A0ABQ9T0P2_9PEZI|nr:uncharacterized protein CPAR01_02596 [Colletotrichum paranaense]KAK1545094.1 hypothetical protein CPAR01_02596 [Colletotrichum paranaense]